MRPYLGSNIILFLHFNRETEPPLVKLNRFHHLLEDERLYQAFNSYLSQEYANENLHFYKHAIELEQCDNPKQSQDLARQLAQEYLGIPGQEQRLNLPSQYIAAIELALQKRKFNNKIFIEARMDIESLLRTKYVSFCNA